MKLTSKGQYAVSAVLFIAVKSSRGPVSLLAIAKQLGISISYAEQLFSILREAGLVKGQRGPGGGYLLGRELADISLGQIIDAVDETTLRPSQKSEEESGPNLSPLCSDLWDEVSKCIRDFLYKIDLNTFLTRQSVRDKLAEQGLDFSNDDLKVA